MYWTDCINRCRQTVPFRLNQGASDGRLFQPLVPSHLAYVIRFRSLVLCSLYKTIHGPSIGLLTIYYTVTVSNYSRMLIFGQRGKSPDVSVEFYYTFKMTNMHLMGTSTYHTPVVIYSCIESAAFLPSPIARMTVAPPRTISPPENTPFLLVLPVS
jgi:hypothetical protein